MEEEGKIFVGGLSWDTTEDGLKNYFASGFGEVSSCVIMKDVTTQRSRGFGFVMFRDPSKVAKVIAKAEHMLDGRKIDPKPAIPRGNQQPPTSAGRGQQPPHQIPNGMPRGRPGPEGRPWQGLPGMSPAAVAANARGGPYDGPTKKIFVGGLPPSTSEDDVRAFFSQHGTVTEVILKYDQNNSRMRGFGFVSFDSEDVVEKLVSKHYVTINTKTVEIKKAEPRNVHVVHQHMVPRHYWETASYYNAPGGYARHGGYGHSANSPAAAPYYGQGYAGAPAGYSAPSYPAYSTGAYASGHYNGGATAGPSYASQSYATSYGTGGGYGTSAAPAAGYDSYNGTTGQGAHRSTYHGEGAYGGSSAAAPGYSADTHSPVAPPMPYVSATGSSSYGQAPPPVTTAADGHGYSGVFASEYRPPAPAAAPAAAAPPSYAQQPAVGPASAQGAGRYGY